MKPIRKRAICALLGMVLISTILLAVVPPTRASEFPMEPTAQRPAEEWRTKRVGAYFFYWYTMPEQPGLLPLEQFFPFLVPGMIRTEGRTTVPPYGAQYEGGTYNTTYYNVATGNGNGDPRRWWEWQFRDMAEAGLDFAVLNSWDGATFFPQDTQLSRVGPYLNGALDALGNPLQIALYDDTTSEVYDWNYQARGSIPPEGCRPPTSPECIQYRMPLNETGNWHYFLDKLDAFYSNIHRDSWATLDGRTVDQGGRPLILMHQGEGLFRNFTMDGTRYAAQLMCTIKKHMIEHFSTADPFLLPNGTWGLWNSGDPALQEPARCSTVGINVLGDPYIIDGWSAYGIASGGYCSDGTHLGTCIFSYNAADSYTTAFLGPGVDIATPNLSPFAYSGPYGGQGPAERPYYNARWSSLQGENLGYCDDGHCQDRYFFQSWSNVIASQPTVDLVVIESWNEIVEGSEISKIATYVAPDLMEGDEPPEADPIFFVDNPYNESPWSPWFWIFRSRDLAKDWRGTLPGPDIQVDDPSSAPGWIWGDDGLGRWFYGSGFHYLRDDAPRAELSWAPSFPETGLYDVYVRWPAVLGATDDAHYKIRYATGESTVRIDQSRQWDAGGWAFLGRYPFQSNGQPDQGVKLTNQVEQPHGERVLADGARFVYHQSWTPPLLEPRAFVPVVVKNTRRGEGGNIVLPEVGNPYPAPGKPVAAPDKPVAAPGKPVAAPDKPVAAPVPAGLPSGYPVPTPTPWPTPTPVPTPTPEPPDHTSPQSRVSSLPTYSGVGGFWVTWSANDEGSGVARLEVQFRDGPQGSWQSWQPYAGVFARFNQGLDAHTYYFRSRATDWSGNVESWPVRPDYDASTILDLAVPSSAVSTLPAYSPAHFTVSWRGQDTGSGIATYDVQYCRRSCTGESAAWSDWLVGTTQQSASFSGQNGLYFFRSRAHDQAGNTERWPTRPDSGTFVDALPPTSVVDTLPEYSHSPFTVSWTGEDGGSGITAYDVQVCLVDCTVPKQAVWIDWQIGITRTQALYTGEDGGVSFRCRARDRVGNQEPYPALPDTTTMVDSAPPSSSVNALPTYRSASFAVSWTGQDAGSGVATYDLQYCIGKCTDPTEEENVWTAWLTGVTTTTASFTGDDGVLYSFRSRAQDRAGNVEAWPVTADASTTVDAIPPSTRMQDLPTYSGPSFVVSWIGQDNTSGIADYDVQYCTGDCSSPTESAWVTWLVAVTRTAEPFTLGQDGQTYAFRGRARDNAGNVETWPGEPYVQTTVDAMPPESVVLELPAYSTSTLTVSWTGQDGGAGVATYDVQVCQDECQDPSTGWSDWQTGVVSTSATWTEGKDGRTLYFRSRAQDRVGNVERWPEAPDASSRVDTAPPRSDMNPLPVYSPASFLVAWKGQDQGVGVENYDVQVCQGDCLSPSGVWTDWLVATPEVEDWYLGQDGQRYSFRCRARDALRNVEEWPAEAQVTTLVDTLPPISRVEPLPAYSTPTFTVTWSGSDGGAGLVRYDVQRCLGPTVYPECWEDWMTSTTATFSITSGTPGQQYAFRSRAWDAAGNVEGYPVEADALTVIDGRGPTTGMEQPAPTGQGQESVLRWYGEDDFSGIAFYDLYLRDESEADWQPWLLGTIVTETTFLAQDGHSYHFCVRGTDRLGNVEEKACPGPAGDWPIIGEAFASAPPTSRIIPLPAETPRNLFEVRWVGSSGTLAYDVQAMDMEDGLWKEWLVGTTATSAWFTGQPGRQYAFRCRAMEASGVLPPEPWPWGPDAVTRIVQASAQLATGPEAWWLAWSGAAPGTPAAQSSRQEVARPW